MNYDDIIHLPHYEPKHHARMPMWNRAAQFAPFAALSGYEAALEETYKQYIQNREKEGKEL